VIATRGRRWRDHGGAASRLPGDWRSVPSRSAATEYGYAMLDRFLHGDRSRPGELPSHADGAHQAPEVARPWPSAPARNQACLSCHRRWSWQCGDRSVTESRRSALISEMLPRRHESTKDRQRHCLRALAR
jgi:hypothetical protein